MVNEELIGNIKARFQQGEKANEIREALLNEGWSDGDISAAFAQIRHEAFLQIPLYAKMHNWMSSLDKKTAQLPTRVLVQIFIVIAIIFIAGVAALYYFLDPLGFRMADRDKQREQAAVAMRVALEKFYGDNNVYPTVIKNLVPEYLPVEPLDPKTKTAYEYKIVNNNYEFCIHFEMQVVRCVTSDDSSSIPTVSEDQLVAPENVQYAINGQIFYDLDKNGERDENSEAPSQLTIKITDAAGTVVCETKTDSSGIFNCNVPGQGQYIVAAVLPKGYTSDLGNPIQVKLPGQSVQLPHVETLFIGLVK